MKSWGFGFVALAAALVADGAQAETATFKDWTVVCDNLRNCTAFGFSDWRDGQGLAHLRLRREGQADAAPQVDILYGDGPVEAPLQAPVDGAPLMTLTQVQETYRVGDDLVEGDRHAVLSAEQVGVLLSATRTGSRLQLASGGQPATLSLDGAQAALRWMDDRQKRAGGSTALVAKGPKGPQAVPAPPPPPVVRAAQPPSQAGLPGRFPKAVRAQFSDCEAVSEDIQETIIARLAPGKILWGQVCQVAAYNVVNRFVMSGEGGVGARRVTLAGDGLDITDGDLVNAGFDLDTMTLSDFGKYRGLSDCGSSEDWVWTGQTFVLAERTLMEECRGLQPEAWPRAYVSERR